MAKWSPLRKIWFWVVYDPKTQEISTIAEFKYQLAVPSRQSGRVVIKCTGFYRALRAKRARS
jgi:hypothetical protein